MVVIRNIGRWVACSNLFLHIAMAEKISQDKRRCTMVETLHGIFGCSTPTCNMTQWTRVLHKNYI
jgi:hypothetical protein